MNRLSTDRRGSVIAALVEGNSIRSTARLTGVSKPAVLKLLEDLGPICSSYQDETLRNLRCRRIQCDELWQYCYAKAKNVPASKRDTFGYGDVWTFVAIDADTKLVPAWLIGPRDADTTREFMLDLAGRLLEPPQISTDAFPPYAEAVRFAFGRRVDYAQTAKNDGKSHPQVHSGDPDHAHISTSYIERQNLTMRMQIRRYTRRTNAFSKKVENLAHAVALHFMHYNFVRIHGSLRCTPAMRAGVSRRLWTIRDVVTLLEEREARQAA
ncbi:MAG: IS1 family transposase [Acidobacteria bacterium]|nr:IS1 family transposase [Acidobacteriota bacterium]MYJ04636.1 IS1 family transposase [Acidobacteriota bacterium]